MNVRHKSRNPVALHPPKSSTSPNIMGRSVLLPSVSDTIPRKHRNTPQGHSKSPYERSALTPPNRKGPIYTYKLRPQSNKITSVSSLVHKKKSNSNKYAMLYSKLRNSHMSKMGVFSNTYAANKKKLNDVDVYNFIDKSQFDLNKTFDMVVQNAPIQKFKPDQTYSNLGGARIQVKNGLLIKQKPAAPEIKKIVSTLTNINTSFSEANMLQYSNVSSAKSFVRPKSMERTKRKPVNTKKKISKSKPRKKTIKRNKKDFSTFNNNDSLMITNGKNDFRKKSTFGRDRSSDNRIKASTSYKNRRQKLDNEIQNL
jgi:hypothetical protein